jgi:hypothetical protein
LPLAPPMPVPLRPVVCRLQEQHWRSQWLLKKCEKRPLGASIFVAPKEPLESWACRRESADQRPLTPGPLSRKRTVQIVPSSCWSANGARRFGGGHLRLSR